jgi:hypothetical protein
MPDVPAARANLVNILSRIVDHLPMATKTYDELYSRLWRGVQRLWNGGKDANFMGTFARSIDVQLTEAWNNGAEDAGVYPEDMTPDDMSILDGIIENENAYIENIANDIQDDKAAGMKQEDFESKYGARVSMWANRFNETESQARIRFGGRQKMKFVMGSTENHCHTGDQPGKIGCADLDGIVLFADEWSQTGIMPGMADSPVLACGGWSCGCSYQPTDERRTRGGLTHVLDMMVGANV